MEIVKLLENFILVYNNNIMINDIYNNEFKNV